MQLAARGYHILRVNNDAVGKEKVSDEIRIQYPVEVQSMTLDLTLISSVNEIIALIDESEILVEVLICNAGMLVFGGLTNTTNVSLEKIIELHCLIPTLLCRELAMRMRKTGQGYILIMSSATAWMPYPTIAAYSATKSYLKTFGRALYYEMRHQGIRVTVVYPGAIDTAFYSLDHQMRQRLLWWKIMLSPTEVARKGLHALFSGHHRCIPGIFTKICVGICYLLPPWLLRPILRIKKIRSIWD